MPRTTKEDLVGNARLLAKELDANIPPDVKYIVIFVTASGNYICEANAPKDQVSRALRSIADQQHLINVVRA
jgi:hypothetical protein